MSELKGGRKSLRVISNLFARIATESVEPFEKSVAISRLETAVLQNFVFFLQDTKREIKTLNEEEVPEHIRPKHELFFDIIDLVINAECADKNDSIYELSEPSPRDFETKYLLSKSLERLSQLLNLCEETLDGTCVLSKEYIPYALALSCLSE